jgi:predicted ATPase/class 3 adenylate cyclase
MLQSSEYPTGTITFLFTDIEGYSTLEESCGALLQPVLDEHNRLLRELAAEHRGIEIRIIGDAFFFVFASASDAVQFAVAAQHALQEFPWKSTFPPSVEVAPELRVRIGMHSGEARTLTHPDGQFDYFGTTVNRAARVSAAGHGGQVLASEATRLLSQGLLPSNISFQDLGLHRLKGVGQVQLWQLSHPGLLDQFPPVSTMTAQKHNLPLALTPFLGREKELQEWKATLLQPATRLLTIAGFGGMGKTRLSQQIAEECSDNFADGVWWVPLENATTGDEMVQRIAEQLVKNLKPQPTVLQQLGNFLRDRELLLVLDNLEQIHPQDVAQALIEMLNTGPRVKILATSRRSLEIAPEKLVELEPFAIREAEALFIERAHARKAGFVLNDSNAADIKAICKTLEGVPLAIEIAASRVALMSPRQILQRLDDQLKLLVARDPSLPPRHTALRGAVEWSYNLLSENTKVLFAQLSVFAGGFTIDAAEVVARRQDNSSFDVLEGLMELRNQSLLRSLAASETSDERLAMLESVREYASEKLSDNETHRRHAEYYRDWTERQSKSLRTAEEPVVVAAVEREFDNLRAALEWCVNSGQHQLAAGTAHGLAHFLERRGLFKESLRCIESGLNAVTCLSQQDVSTKILHAALLRERASAHHDQQQWNDARDCAKASLALFEECDDAVGVASAYNQLGLAACRTKEFAAARAYFQQAETAYKRAGDASGQAIVWHNLGLTASESGDLNEAAQFLERALQLRRDLGDQRGLAETLNNLGVVAQEQGDWQKAETYYCQSLSCELALQDAFGAARALFNLGEIAELQDCLQQAWRLFSAADHLFYEVGSPYREYAMDAKQRVAENDGLSREQEEALITDLKSKDLKTLSKWAMQEDDSEEMID